jgi:hypothetical protein
MTPEAVATFQRDGVLVVDRLIPDARAAHYAMLCEPLLTGPRRKPGARGVLRHAPGLTDMIHEPGVKSCLDAACGTGWRIVRSILFDKSPDTNWAVGWHQDPTIAVAERIDLPGFGPWSVKDGEPHCQPPVAVLDAITVLRIHLDPVTPASGPLCVVAGSHTCGIIPSADLDDLAKRSRIVEGCTPAGGATLTRPLSVHSSARAAPEAGRRRVLHMEFSTVPLPSGLRWAESP